MEGQRYTRSESMIQDVHNNTPLYLRVMKKVDFFAFIPVPKDQAVSTRRSMFGSTVFIIIFLSYVIFDFLGFILNNPPIQQNYFTPIGTDEYNIPDFGINFVEGQFLNETDHYQSFFQFVYTQESKGKGTKKSQEIDFVINRKDVDWMDQQTKDFYKVLRFPSVQAKAKGLLYSTANTTYSKITVLKCDLNVKDNACASQYDIRNLTAKGRIFLFVQNKGDERDVSFTLYNSFLIPNVYKRITIQLQVQKKVTLPDYFWRWSLEQTQQISILSVAEQTSDTSINDEQKNQSPLEMMGITFQMAPQILNTRISYVTFLDHVSKWGAFWGVLFAFFAILFLGYNKKKFYKRNPQWDRFRYSQKKGSLQSSGYVEYTGN